MKIPTLRPLAAAALLAALALLGADPAPSVAADTFISDVRNTKHNLSAGSGNTVRASSESQVCVFCHTPHGATPGVAPLWNRKLGATSYKPYTSTSLDAEAIQGQLDQPGGSSKLCLSCHDGTVAIGSVNVLNGVGSATAQGTVSINMIGTTVTGMMPGSTTSGFTRNLGTDLTNDHPISVTYSNALALRDGDLRAVDANQNLTAGGKLIVGNRGTGARPVHPLEPSGTGGVGQVQCATCHDPHRRELDPNKGNQKFLRANRFQEADPKPDFVPATDIICLSCHDKNNGSVGSWAYSAHANPLVATQTYKPTPAATREFPSGIPVWKASCLNCHDTHSVPGSRRLLREGVDGANPSIEANCWQCHVPSSESIVSGTVPDIRTDFNSARRMPIRASEQPAGGEVHDIAGNFSDTWIDCTGVANACGRDFLEPRSRLATRHAECTDCHNPHRVVRFQKYYGIGGSLTAAPDARSTHVHTAGVAHDNVASGVLRGSWGVEPIYGAASFFALPSGYNVKRGDPGNSVDTTAAAGHVTREYQVCLKCHSDYGYTDDNVLPSGNTRPVLGPPGTSSPRANYTRYTNQAREFQAPAGHRGAATTSDSGAGSGWQSNNHRSWHPVIDSTGRTATIRGGGSNISNNWLAPFNVGVGSLTMYCTDCHGSATANNTVVPPAGSPWGPHGSANDFILKGPWNTLSGAGSGGDTNALCFRCHQQNIYAPTSGGGGRTGFYTGFEDGHYIHSERGRLGGLGNRCNWCHVAVPHGWKNKALLVNLNDTGPEVNNAPGTAIPDSSLPYTNGPYYRNAMLKVKTFRSSGNWSGNDCGSPSINSFQWMRSVCKARAP